MNRRSSCTAAVLLRLALALAPAALLPVSLAGCARAPKEHAIYRCPMHPAYVSDRPGDCAICGMKLVRDESTVAPATAPTPFEPMESHAAARETPWDSAPPAIASLPAGMAAIEVGPDAMRLAGLVTAEALRGAPRRTLRTVGQVVPDERRVQHVHVKTAGWVERLHVNFTGQHVRRGEPVLDLYSPELLASQEEYLRALELAERLGTSSLDGVGQGARDLVAAARRRLELLDVPARDLDALARTRRAPRTVPLHAPATGYITAKDAYQGMRVEPGQDLFTVTDISRVWVEADVYQFEATRVHVGQEAAITLAYGAASPRKGEVTYIDPVVRPETRTLRVRFEFANPDLALKPGMFADVELQVEAPEGIVVPDSAVMDTGTRQVVFVETAPGRLEPRQVRIGIRGGGQAQVVEGLAPGERVVVRANFLVDSESRLRAALAAMHGGSPPGPPGPPGGHGAHGASGGGGGAP